MWEQLPSGRVVHRFEWVVIGAALALIPVLVIDADVDSGGWQTAATAANWVIWGVFLAELAFILIVAPRKLAALRAHWLEAAVAVVTAPAFGAFLSSLRVIRLARLLRLLRLGMIGARLLRAERSVTSEVAFRYVALVTLLVVVVAGAVESFVDEENVHSVWDGIWWAVVTVTSTLR